MSAVNSASISPSSSPASMSNAPKFGTRVPNRVFVGGISSSTSESELFDLFSTFGCVKETKIIADRAGVSKGYGFVTFSCEEEAENILKEESVVLNDRKLNVAPAIRKQFDSFQPFGRIYGSPDNRSERGGSNSGQSPRGTPDWSLTSPEPAPISSSGTVFYHNGVYQNPYSNGGVIYQAADGTCQYSQPAQAYYPIIYSPTLYIPQQQYQYQTSATAQAQWTNQQIRWAAHVGYGQSPSPQASATTASTPQYIYTSNGVSGTSIAASSSNTSINQISSLGSNQTQGGGDISNLQPNGSSTVAFAYTYPPPPLHHNIYQPPPLIGGQTDLVETSVVEVQQQAEPQQPVSQDSTGPTDHRGILTGPHGPGRFTRGSHHQGPASDNYRFLRPFEQRNIRGGGGTSHSPRKQFQYHCGVRQPHHHSPQYHPRNRPPFKPMPHYHDSGSYRGPLTPPSTPSAQDGPSDSNLVATTKQLATLKI